MERFTKPVNGTIIQLLICFSSMLLIPSCPLLFLFFKLFTILNISASVAGFKNIECFSLSFRNSSGNLSVFEMFLLSSYPIVQKKSQKVFDISLGSVICFCLCIKVSVWTNFSGIFQIFYY